jgi:hypothetical protein
MSSSDKGHWVGGVVKDYEAFSDGHEYAISLHEGGDYETEDEEGEPTEHYAPSHRVRLGGEPTAPDAALERETLLQYAQSLGD